MVARTKTTSIRRRRKERARQRVARQKIADLLIKERCKWDFNFACATFGGTICPECKKPVPARALFSITGMYGDIHLLGCMVRQEYCHRDAFGAYRADHRSRCVVEARVHWGKQYLNISDF